MARGLEFDYNKAIDAATQLFWKTGYTNTSLRDLLKVMGIGEGSFYNTVGSKENLYLECMKRYNETIGRKRMEALFSEGTARSSILAFFDTILDDLDDPDMPRVCLMSGSLDDEVLGSCDIRKYVVLQMSTIGDLFIQRLNTAKETGELPPEFDSELASEVIGTYLQGLFRVVVVSYDRPKIEHQIDALLTGLGL